MGSEEGVGQKMKLNGKVPAWFLITGPEKGWGTEINQKEARSWLLVPR